MRTAALDERDMVCDFSDIKRVVKDWVDRELDHKMILRRDDPLVEPLRVLGEPVYLVDSNPTVECLAQLIHQQAKAFRFACCASDGLGNPLIVRDLQRAVAGRRC